VDEDVITELEREHQVYTAKVTITDYDFVQPSMNLESSASDEDYEEIYDYPGKYSKLSDGERYASLRLQEKAAAQEVVRGVGKCRAFRSGYEFDLSEHYRADSNQTYFLKSVWHSAHGGGYRTSGGEAEYSNEFECVPASIPFRPASRTPKPVVQGSQTALVVGPSGEEIFTEKNGQVKVQFHWDRVGQRDENSSCWVRVSHPWAGKGWGAVSIPRIGQEVIVDFLEGDPDRPIITGRVYNAEVMPPFPLPDGAVVSGIKSATHKGSGYNEMSMNDTPGEEKFTVNAQYDKGTTVGNDSTESVGNNRSSTVSVDDSLSVGSNQSVDVGSNQSISVSGDRTVSVSGSQTTEVSGTRTVIVSGSDSVATSSDHSLDASGAINLTSGAAMAINVGAGLDVNASANIKIGAGGTIEISAPGGIKLMAGGTSIDMTPGSISINGAGMFDVVAGLIKHNG
jgi:type VI secretion system secreted protein VgrG